MSLYLGSATSSEIPVDSRLGSWDRTLLPEENGEACLISEYVGPTLLPVFSYSPAPGYHHGSNAVCFEPYSLTLHCTGPRDVFARNTLFLFLGSEAWSD